jgi:hypothetical protein
MTSIYVEQAAFKMGRLTSDRQENDLAGTNLSLLSLPHKKEIMVLPAFHDVVLRRRPTSTRCPNKVLPIIKGCLILVGFVLLASFEVYSLARSVHSSSPADSGSKVNACVRKVEQKCMLYPCQDQNGAIEEIAPSSLLPFGYAGNFVLRQGNITKPHELVCKQYASSSLIHICCIITHLIYLYCT